MLIAIIIIIIIIVVVVVGGSKEIPIRSRKCSIADIQRWGSSAMISPYHGRIRQGAQLPPSRFVESSFFNV
jgi:hypothetical protein